MALLGALGDINGDGFEDVMIGDYSGTKPNYASQVGNAFVIFGAEGPFTDLAMTSDWTASAVGFVIWGPEMASDFMLVRQNGGGLGDVNGDGVDDFAVSAYRYGGPSIKGAPGIVFLIFGKKSPQTFANIDLHLAPDKFGESGIYYIGANILDYTGYSIARAGDFNGDGIADFLMGAVNYDPSAVNSVTRSNAGAVYLIHGSKTALVTMDLSTFVTGAMGVRFLGSVGTTQLGEPLTVSGM